MVVSSRVAWFAPALCLVAPVQAQQMTDTAFHPVVPRAAYGGEGGPRVVIDAAHLNFHTAAGRYKPFADLLRLDGYRVASNTSPFTPDALRGVDVLVIANAQGGEGPAAFDTPAFTPDEVKAVHDWVDAGGSLLLVADHAPFGTGAEVLSQAFGVSMGKGFTLDTAPANSSGNPSFLRFSRANGLLGDHPIIQGRDPGERVGTVLTFTGQSLGVPAGASALLALSPTAMDRAPPTRGEAAARAERINLIRDSLRAEVAKRGRAPPETLVLGGPATAGAEAPLTSAAGRAQGVALTSGGGRVVILGEAGFLTAQVIAIPGMPVRKMGMNVDGTDDQQFALNVMHWLSQLLN